MRQLVLFAVVFSLMLAGHAHAAEKKGKVLETKAEKSRGSGKDENVKSDEEPKNSASAKTPAPPSKGGDKSRGVYCTVHIDNHTAYYVRIYVDGIYSGTVPPWGDIYPTAISGATRLYARAVFEDGSYFSWGPRTFDCEDYHTWQLNY